MEDFEIFTKISDDDELFDFLTRTLLIEEKVFKLLENEKVISLLKQVNVFRNNF